jgi:outer membrane protein OmpA-like peptidoglycan-associated protein
MRTHFFVFLFLLAALLTSAQEAPQPKSQALNKNINSKADELYPLFSSDGNTLYFVRSVSGENKGGTRGGQDIWYVQKQKDSTWGRPVNAGNLINNKRNNLLGGFSANMQRMYVGNRYDKAAPGILFLTLKEGKYENPALVIPDSSLPRKGYFCFYVHPSEEVMVASMDTAGNGNEDLYFSLKEPQGWSPWKSFPANLNTRGFETSPWLSADKKQLFFSSNGHTGYGDGDLFCSTRMGKGWNRWSTPVNLGKYINTAGFDAYFSISPDGKTAVYSSGESPEAGADLYSIPLEDVKAAQPKDTVRLECTQGIKLSGSIAALLGKKEHHYFGGARALHSQSLLEAAEQPDFLDYNPMPDFLGYDTLLCEVCKNRERSACDSLVVVVRVKEFVSDAIITVVNKLSRETLQVYPQVHIRKLKNLMGLDKTQNGSWLAHAHPGALLDISVNEKGYFSVTDSLQLQAAPVRENRKTIELLPLETGNTITLRNILFSTGKAELMESSYVQLEKLLSMMQNNPGISILIAGHTDNVGKPKANQVLSEKRVQAVGAYLVKKGIAAGRISTKGFGSSKPVSENTTEEGRQLNRRVEITVR